jgi:DNA ligase-1
MKAFADLYAALDETTKTNEKVGALTGYFARVPPGDAAWAAT